MKHVATHTAKKLEVPGYYLHIFAIAYLSLWCEMIDYFRWWKNKMFGVDTALFIHIMSLAFGCILNIVISSSCLEFQQRSRVVIIQSQEFSSLCQWGKDCLQRGVMKGSCDLVTIKDFLVTCVQPERLHISLYYDWIHLAPEYLTLDRIADYNWMNNLSLLIIMI